jgi:HD-GYP domain-containing protein (c-di-GMP phosphodiesterase class II)
MGGRQAEPRIRFARVACSDPETTAFRISGSLGPRAKPYLVRLTAECLRRNLPSVVLDLSGVEALGGGTARVLNEFAAERAARGGKTAFCVASRTVRGFLCADPALPPPLLAGSLEEAVSALRGRETRLFLDDTPAPRPRGLPDRGVGRAPEPSFDASDPFFGPEPARPIAVEVDEDLETFLAEAPLLDPPRAKRPQPRPSVPPQRPRQEPPARGTVWALTSRAPLPEPFEVSPARDEPRSDLPLVDSLDDMPAGETSGALERGDRLARALRDNRVASRIFVFEQQADGSYCLLTKQGMDRNTVLPRDGELARALRALESPGFVMDLCAAKLDEAESELLTQLNCEVVAPAGAGGRADLVVFVSKERPGDEYSLEELEALERVLQSAGPASRAPHSKIRNPLLNRNEIQESPRKRNVTQRPSSETSPGERLAAPLLWPDELDGDIDSPPQRFQPKFDLAPAKPAPRDPSRVDTGRMAASRPRELDPSTVNLRRGLAQMRDILSLSQDFDASFGTSRILEAMVLSVVSVARVESVLYFAARQSEYRLTHHRGVSPEAIQGLRLRADSSLVQSALASPRGVCIREATQVTEEERIWARQHGLGHAVPFRFKDETLGILLLGSSAETTPPDLELLGFLLGQAGVAYDRARLSETLQDRTLGVVRGLITLIESRNGFDCGSTEQVVRYTQALARELQYPQESLRDLIFGAVLRDVGMLQVSETLLRSADDLSGDQWEAIRRHPVEGASIMRQMRFSGIAVDVVLHHHEAYNGEGYPMNLRGRAIPLGARLVAVAESYVKMTMDRPYRKALGKAEALESLAENWGLRYDPLVVDALVRVVNRELSLGLKGDHDLTHDLFGV